MRPPTRGTSLAIAAVLLLAGAPAYAGHRPTAPARSTAAAQPRPDFPWLPPARRAAARQALAERDAKVAAALSAADRAWAARHDPHAAPVRPKLPPLAYLYDSGPALPVQAPALPASGATTESTDAPGYQSDHLMLDDFPDDAYGSDYNVWLAVPQSNELNQCDSQVWAPLGTCVWFYAMQYNTTATSAMHIGPVRGLDAGSGVWRMNVGGYNDDATHPVGGTTSAPDLPVSTWIRVRTMRQSNTATTGTYGVWAMWSNVDHYIGSITIKGPSITYAVIFNELLEQDSSGPCTTDLERGYMYAFTLYRNNRQYSFPTARADYGSNCGNTTWKVAGAPDFISDERETARTIPQDALVWDRRRLDYNWDALPHTRGGVDLRVVLRPRGYLMQPFVAGKPMFYGTYFVAGCGYCIVDLHIYTNRDGTGHVCTKLGVQVIDNVFTKALIDDCYLNVGQYYYLQVYNTSFTTDATMYLVDVTGGNPNDFAYVANGGTMPSSTALRSLIWTRDQ